MTDPILSDRNAVAEEYATVEPFADFPFEEVDRDQHEFIREELRKSTARAVSRFCVRLLELGRSPKQIFQAVNAYAFAAHIHPEQDKTLEEIAEKFRISKQAFTNEVNHIRDRLGLPRVGGARKNHSRKSVSRAAKQSHERRKINGHTNGHANGTFIARFRQAHLQAGV